MVFFICTYRNDNYHTDGFSSSDDDSPVGISPVVVSSGTVGFSVGVTGSVPVGSVTS